MKYKVGIFAILITCLVCAALFLRSNKDDEPSKIVAKKSYVALGDSVSAGIGLPSASDSSACNRTDESYPFVLAKSLNYSLTNVSCSGATIAAGISGKQDVNKLLVDSQLDQLFAMQKPDVITLTVGANDAGWLDILTKCYTAVCGTTEDTNAITAKLTTLTQNISTVLNTISTHYNNSGPKIVVTGYYLPVSTTETCADTTGITTTEATWIANMLGQLNNAIQAAATSTATYVPINFTNHELCSQESWVQGLQERAPFHPNELGQKNIANSINTGMQK